MKTDKVSIILIASDDVNNTKLALGSILKAKNNVDIEIILVGPEILQPLSRHYSINLILGDDLSMAKLKNIGVENATGNYLFFSDIYNRVENYWLDKMILNMKDAQCVVPIMEDAISQKKLYGGKWDKNFNFTWYYDEPENNTEIPLLPGYAFWVGKDFFKEI